MFKILVHLYDYAESYTVLLLWILIPLFVYLVFHILKYNITHQTLTKSTQLINNKEKTPQEENLPTYNEPEDALNLLTSAMSELLEDEKAPKGEKNATNQ